MNQNQLHEEQKPKKVILQLSTDREEIIRKRKLKGNRYPRIFTSGDAYRLFERIKIELVNPGQLLASYSFIFRQMQVDGYIYINIGEKEFRDWLNDTYQVALDKLKTLSRMKSKDRQTIYYLLKEVHF